MTYNTVNLRCTRWLFDKCIYCEVTTTIVLDSTPIISHNYSFLSLMRKVKVYSLSILQMYNTTLLTIVPMLYVTHLITRTTSPNFDQHLPTFLTILPPETSNLLSVYEFGFLIFFYSTYKNVQYSSFSVSHISLPIMPSRSTHHITNGRVFLFLWLNNIPLCIYTTFSSSIHLLMNI